MESEVCGRLCGPHTSEKLPIITPGVATACLNQVYHFEGEAAFRDDFSQASMLLLPAAL